MVNRKIFGKIKGFLPNLNDLADVMDPLYAGEALAPLPEVIPNPDTVPGLERAELKMSPAETPAPSKGSKIKEEVKTLAPSLDELADVMDPLYAGEALAPITDGSSLKLDLKIDFINRIFANVMKLSCNVGLAIIILSAALYFTGVNPSDNLGIEVAKWNEPASTFWKDVKGIDVNGYSYFLSTFTDPESGVIIGTSLLAFTPLLGFILSIPKTNGTLRILLVIIAFEFIYAIVRPLIMNIGGVE